MNLSKVARLGLRWFVPLLLFLSLQPSQASTFIPLAERDRVLRRELGTLPDWLLTDAQVAEEFGITIEQVRRLHTERSLSNAQIERMPAAKLKRALWRLENPMPDHPAEAVEFRLMQQRDEHGKIPHNALMNAVQQMRQMPVDPAAWQNIRTVQDWTSTIQPLNAGIQPSAWTWLGPGNIGGRVRSILVHPTTPTTMYASGVSGGIWKTLNGGTSWFPLNDFMANLAVSCLAMDPSDPNVLYAGTGEGFYNGDGIRGAGIFKTTDGGANWTQHPSTTSSTYYYVNRLTIHPTSTQIILAATRSGLFRSADGGTTWSQQYFGEIFDLDFDPTDGTKCIASGPSGLALYSTDGGLNWSAATGLPVPSGFDGRVEVAYAPSSPTNVYASVQNNSGEVYRSTDGGQTYSLRNTGNNYLGSQGWYDNALWVDPTNPNIIIVGGIDLWRSTDGGGSLTKISQWFSAPSSAHADHHAIVHHSGFDGVTNKTVYFGNDGGIYRANNVYTVSLTSGWTELDNNFGITQFYGGAGNSNTTVIVGGTQDNGTLRYTTGGGTEGWTTMFGGDGGFCAADQTNPNYFYGEYVYLQIHRSSNGGASSSYIYSGITDAELSRANFISPFILDPNNANTMLAGGSNLWRSVNVKTTTPTWTNIKSYSGSYISAIAVAPGNSAIIWVGHNNGDVYRTANGTAGSPTWTRADLGTPNLPNRYCQRLTIDPTNSNRVYATFGGFSADNVWRTTDNGVTWSNITGNLPAAPVRSLVVAPFNNNFLYVGTEVGVFASADGGATWSPGNDGPANVSVDELFWMGNKLVAATHGRGLFTVLVLPNPVIAVAGSSVAAESCMPTNGVVDPGETVTVNLSVTNLSTTATTNLIGTLQATGGVTAPSGPQTYGALTGGGPAVAEPFTFTANGACGSNITATLDLQDGTNSLGSVQFTFPLGALGPATTNTYSTGGIAAGIPDESSVEVSMSVTDTGVVADVNVRVRLNHTYDGDLVIDLVHPDGSVVNLASNRGGSSDNYGSGAISCAGTFTMFDDAGATAIGSGSAPFAGTFKPEQLLSALNGKSTQGTWKLRVTDTAAIDTGTIYCVQLDIARQPFVCCMGPVNQPPVITNAFITPSLPDTTQTLTAFAFASDPESNAVTFAYQWQRSTNDVVYTNLTSQTASTLPAAATIAGDFYRVIVTPNDGLTNGTPFTTASVLVPVDADGNGINDDWEVQHFGHIGIDPNADPDGDGFSNLQEFLAGTDPLNAHSALRITAIDAVVDDIRITWSAVGGKSYLVQTNAPSDGSFTNDFGDLSPEIALPGSGETSTNYLDIGGLTNAPSRFYRVRLKP